MHSDDSLNLQNSPFEQSDGLFAAAGALSRQIQKPFSDGEVAQLLQIAESLQAFLLLADAFLRKLSQQSAEATRLGIGQKHVRVVSELRAFLDRCKGVGVKSERITFRDLEASLQDWSKAYESLQREAIAVSLQKRCNAKWEKDRARLDDLMRDPGLAALASRWAESRMRADEAAREGNQATIDRSLQDFVAIWFHDLLVTEVLSCYSRNPLPGYTERPPASGGVVRSVVEFLEAIQRWLATTTEELARVSPLSELPSFPSFDVQADDKNRWLSHPIAGLVARIESRLLPLRARLIRPEAAMRNYVNLIAAIRSKGWTFTCDTLCLDHLRATSSLCSTLDEVAATIAEAAPVVGDQREEIQALAVTSLRSLLQANKHARLSGKDRGDVMAIARYEALGRIAGTADVVTEVGDLAPILQHLRYMNSGSEQECIAQAFQGDRIWAWLFSGNQASTFGPWIYAAMIEGSAEPITSAWVMQRLHEDADGTGLSRTVALLPYSLVTNWDREDEDLLLWRVAVEQVALRSSEISITGEATWEFIQRHSARHPLLCKWIRRSLESHGRMRDAVPGDESKASNQPENEKKRVEIKELRQEVLALEQYGSLSARASQVLLSLCGHEEQASIQFNADSPSLLWAQYPRCAVAWHDGVVDLKTYRTLFFEDIGEKCPVDYALSLAAEGRIDRAVAVVGEQNPEVIQWNELWSDIVGESMEQLRESTRASGVNEEVASLFKKTEDCLMRRDYKAASAELENVKAVWESKKPSNDEVAVIRQKLDDLIGRLCEEPLRARSEQGGLLTRAVQLQRDVSRGAVSRAIADVISRLEEQISEVEQADDTESNGPASAERNDAAVSESAPTALASSSAATEVPDHLFGVVKPFAGGPECKAFGFVVPYGGQGSFAATNAIHFPKVAVSEDTPMLEGTVVVCGNLTRVDARGLKAGSVRRATDDELSRYKSSLGVVDNALILGLTSVIGDRILVATEFWGVHSLRGASTTPPGSFVSLDRQALANGRIAIVGPAAEPIAESRKSFLKRLVEQPERRGTQSDQPLSSARWEVNGAYLRQLLDPSPNAIRWAKELHEHIRKRDQPSRDVERTIAAIDCSEDDKRWLKAVLVYGMLQGAMSLPGQIDQRNRIEEILQDLPEWLEAADRRNPDVTYHRVYTCLRDFEKRYPNDLDCDHIYNCFEAVQQRRPHFRIEILLATDKADRLEADGDALNEETKLAQYMEIIEHLERAEILNPRLNEILDLRRRLARDFSSLQVLATGLRERTCARVVGSGSTLGRINEINAQYRTFRQMRANEKARTYFESHRAAVVGIERERLYLTHAAFLSDQGNAADAEMILVDLVRYGDLVGGWQDLITQLARTWTEMRLPYADIRRTITAIRASLPQGQLHALISTGVRVALDSSVSMGTGDLTQALDDAKAAQAISDTPDARDLVARCEERLGWGAAKTGDSIDGQKQRLLSDVLRLQGIEPDSAITRFVRSTLQRSSADGAWLVLQVVKRKCLTSAAAKRLVAEACDGITAPDRNLFESQLRVAERNWDGEGGLSALLNSGVWIVALEAPTEENLSEIRGKLTIPAAKIFFESLAKHHRKSRSIENERLVCRHLLRAMTDAKDKKGFVRALFQALPVIVREDVKDVVDGLSTLDLDGLAAAVVIWKSGIPESDVVQYLMRATVSPYWRWPDFWHEAKSAVDWYHKAELLMRVLATNRLHWPACQEFVEVCAGEMPEEYDRNLRIQLAAAFVLGLARAHKSAELTTLRAQLLHAQADLEGRLGHAEIIRQCEDLLEQALEICPSFSTAIEFRNLLAAPKRLRIGQRLGHEGRYQVVGRLGEGGFSVVYKADDAVSRDAVVLKVMKTAATLGHEPRFENTFQNEIKAAGSLAHPHIVAIRGVLEEGKIIVMDYIEGETLHDVIEGRIVNTWRTAARIGVQVASALKYAYDTQQIVHRDIQPGNIMVTNIGSDPKATVIDFGLAKRGQGTSTVAATFDIVKKRWVYRPAEYSYQQQKDPRLDIFGLGIILYHILLQRGPWTAEEWDEIHRKYGADPSVLDRAEYRPRRLSHFNPTVNDQSEGYRVFEEATLRMVQVLPQDRIGSWDIVLDEFQKSLSGAKL